jgi:hypothetical protein
MHGAVILPDHVRFLRGLPSGDGDFPKRVGLVKVGEQRWVGDAHPTKLGRPSTDQAIVSCSSSAKKRQPTPRAHRARARA